MTPTPSYRHTITRIYPPPPSATCSLSKLQRLFWKVMILQACVCSMCLVWGDSALCRFSLVGTSVWRRLPSGYGWPFGDGGRDLRIRIFFPGTDSKFTYRCLQLGVVLGLISFAALQAFSFVPLGNRTVTCHFNPRTKERVGWDGNLIPGSCP